MAAITFSTCDTVLLLRAQYEKALNGTGEDSAFPTMTLVDGWIIVTTIPLLAGNSREKAETIQKYVEMVQDADTVSSFF